VKKQYKILDWDSDHFGFKVASISDKTLNLDKLSVLLESMRLDRVRLAYWASNHVANDSCMNNFGGVGKLVDRKVVFIKSITEDLGFHAKKNVVNVYEEETVCDELDDLAIQSGVYSRFNIDENIDQLDFESLYKKWIEKSVLNKDVEVHVVLLNNIIVGMITLFIENECGKIGLLSVDKNSRGLGVGKDLLYSALERFKLLKCKTVEVITQQENTPACNLYKMFAFEVKQVGCFYHFWL